MAAFLEAFDGAGHDPYTQFESQIFTQSDYFFYTFLDAAHAQGQPAAAGRAFDREVARMAKRYPRFARALARALHRERLRPGQPLLSQARAG